MPPISHRRRHRHERRRDQDQDQPSNGGRSLAPPDLNLEASSSRDVSFFDGFFKGDKTEEDIPKEHINYEYIAHHLAYQGEDYIRTNETAREVLGKMGFQTDTYGFKEGTKGFQALLLFPAGEGIPVLAIRGTNDFADVTTDLDVRAVGRSQFTKNESCITELLAMAGGKVAVTGHSLGGAMAQHVAANYTSQVSEVTTFQSPGVDLLTKDKYKENLDQLAPEEHPDITHHIANNDFVDKAGDFNLKGDYYKHKLKGFIGPFTAHTSYLFGTDQFEEERAAVGLDKETFESHIGKEIFEQNPNDTNVSHHEKYPHPLGRLGSEILRRGAGLVTSPLRFLFGRGRSTDDEESPTAYSEDRDDFDRENSR